MGDEPNKRIMCLIARSIIQQYMIHTGCCMIHRWSWHVSPTCIIGMCPNVWMHPYISHVIAGVARRKAGSWHVSPTCIIGMCPNVWLHPYISHVIAGVARRKAGHMFPTKGNVCTHCLNSAYHLCMYISLQMVVLT